MCINLRKAYRSFYKLHLYIDQVLNCYPKKYYHPLGMKTRELNIHILVSLYHLAKATPPSPETFQSLYQDIHTLEFYLRLGSTYQIVSEKQLSYILFHLETFKYKTPPYRQ